MIEDTSESERDQDIKRGRHQGEKRTREGASSDENKRVTRSKWKELTAETSPSETGYSTPPPGGDESDSDAVLTIQSEAAIEVAIPASATVPTKGTEGSAGYDCRASQSLLLKPHTVTKVDLGFSAAIPNGYYFQLTTRSSTT